MVALNSSLGAPCLLQSLPWEMLEVNASSDRPWRRFRSLYDFPFSSSQNAYAKFCNTYDTRSVNSLKDVPELPLMRPEEYSQVV